METREERGRKKEMKGCTFQELREQTCVPGAAAAQDSQQVFIE